MDSRDEFIWMSDELKDMYGKVYKVGDRVAKAMQSGRSVNMTVGTVTRIENGKMYLDNSKQPVWYPGRMLIVTKVFE